MNENYYLPDTISVAISFSRGSHDEYREAIINIIQGFERRTSYKVSVYIDRDNYAGDDFKRKIDEHFRKADIIICLVTNSFLENPYVLKHEKPIIEKFTRCWVRDKKVIPIIVSRTNNYIKSWLGRSTKTTLPTEEAPIRPYSSYPNKEHANLLIKDGLHAAFKDFHNKVVIRRIDKKQVLAKPYDNKVIWALITVFILAMLFLLYRDLNKEVEPSPSVLNSQPSYTPDTNMVLNPSRKSNPVRIEPKAVIDPNEPQVSDSDFPIKPTAYQESQSILASCNSKESMETMFPRTLSSYSYFGKERYGRYESCQSINEDGYKPCKRNRKWYIVNESKRKHLLLELDDETHKDIYAIRPLLNDIAEVYFFDGKTMYLSFCVSLEDGGLVE